MNFNIDFFNGAYLIVTVLFIYGLKGLSSPKTALLGNASAMLGMALAITITILQPEVTNYSWILVAIGAGAIIGIPLAHKINMTAMPQLVAFLHSTVGVTAVLVGVGTYLKDAAAGVENIPITMAIELAVGSFVGAITFTGSMVAFGKLQQILKSKPLVFKGQHYVNLLLMLSIIGFGLHFVFMHNLDSFLIMIGLSLLIGFLLVLPIGGADMPVVISMHNSYSGWAAAATGFILNNQLLIATGALVGSSGAILSYIMCRAMNRKLSTVMSGGVGSKMFSESIVAQATNQGVKSAAIEDAAFILGNASTVIIVPGYGMAVSQAHHAVKDLYEVLTAKGVNVKFAIHPVAGRMPGHMNVLLAESDISYDVVFAMDEINSEFPSVDVVFVVGANDVVNPAAKTVATSPLYGMPILEVYKARNILISKRSMSPGYSGVDNQLFYLENCSLVFGDAKSTCEAITKVIREE